MKDKVTLMVAAAFMAAMPPTFAADTKAQCIECHGEAGIATSSGYPNLAGQHPAYLLKQLRDFREGRRSSPFMNIVAAKLSTEEVQDMVRYFANLNPSPGGAATPDARARMLYLQGDARKSIAACAQCHGTDAKGAGEIPALRGQQMFYLREQLLNFRAGQRNNSPARVMNQAADALSDADIDALAQYLSQQ